MMKFSLSRIRKNEMMLLKQIGREAASQGLNAYAVGGFVRDLMLGRRSPDLDIVVEGDKAQEFARYFSGRVKAGIVAYQQFGTATVFLPDGFRFDVVAARKERYPFSGSLPVVEPGSIYDDLFRRDFAVNAMAASLAPDAFGRLVDYFGGVEDLRRKKIRVLHPQSFSDDPTRILRAVRFEQRLGFTIEPATLKLLKEALARGVVSNVKPQRYFEEFKKVLSEKDPAPCLQRLYALKGLGFLGSGIRPNAGTWKIMRRVKHQIVWFKKKFPAQKNLEEWLVYFMVLADNLSLAQSGRLAEHFNLSKENRKKMESVGNIGMIVRKLAQNSLPYEAYKILQPLADEVILLCRLRAKPMQVRVRVDRFLSEHKEVRPYLRGEDLMKLGIRPGKPIGTMLASILEARINGRVKSRFDELKLAEALKSKIRRSA